MRSDTVGDIAALEAAFAALEQGITIHDRDGRVVACNPAAARVIGQPVDEILGEKARYNSYDVRYPGGEVVTERNSGITRALETGETELGRLVELRPHEGGKSRWLRVNYQPLFGHSGDTAWGVLASFVEVEERGACASTIAPVAFHHAPEPIVALDSGGFALGANAAARAIERQSVVEVLTGIPLLVRTVMSPEKFSFFLLTGKILELAAHEGWQPGDSFLREFHADSALFAAVVKERRFLVASDPESETILNGEGLLAGPLFSEETGEDC